MAKNLLENAFKASDIKIKPGTPVCVRLNDHQAMKPEERNTLVFGFWEGVKAHPDINPILIQNTNGLHWLAEVRDGESESIVNDIPLAFITAIQAVEPKLVRK